MVAYEKIISPKQFLQMRHPKQFSDSYIEMKSELDRSHLEYHLSTITSRIQENDFANFSLLLCQKEICPNLLPQTGPLGGGDSKVDSETYPVSEQLSFKWYYGNAASSERWAFAFSAKKEWQSKIKSDVQKIFDTGRGYKKVFFVTNQFVPDKKRSEIEDDLGKKFNLDVRILDRTWILNRVFTN